MSREWTNYELNSLRERMKRCLSWQEVAAAMPTHRTIKACQQQANKRGWYMDKPRAGLSTAQSKRVHKRHAAGWSDQEIANELGCSRRKIARCRRELDLPCNAYNQRHRERARQRLRVQLREANAKTLAQIQQQSRALDAWRSGWPVDCAPIMVEVLDHLEANAGLSTYRAFCAATGRKHHCKAVSTTNGKSAFQVLIDRGHITRAGHRRYARGRGCQSALYRLITRRRMPNLGNGASRDDAA